MHRSSAGTSVVRGVAQLIRRAAPNLPAALCRCSWAGRDVGAVLGQRLAPHHQLDGWFLNLTAGAGGTGSPANHTASAAIASTTRSRAVSAATPRRCPSWRQDMSSTTQAPSSATRLAPSAAVLSRSLARVDCRPVRVATALPTAVHPDPPWRQSPAWRPALPSCPRSRRPPAARGRSGHFRQADEPAVHAPGLAEARVSTWGASTSWCCRYSAAGALEGGGRDGSGRVDSPGGVQGAVPASPRSFRRRTGPRPAARPCW